MRIDKAIMKILYVIMYLRLLYTLPKIKKGIQNPVTLIKKKNDDIIVRKPLM